MRPVERGAVPNDAAGNPKVFADYADARADLYGRLGRYCSFCERRIAVSLAVEHVRPKSIHPKLRLTWSNFLLGCDNCNPTKGSRSVGLHLFLPDRDNTVRALEYQAGGIVRIATSLTGNLKGKATRLIRLVGLDKGPTNDPQAKDLRWNDRREAWDKATRYFTKYQAGSIGIDEIVELCRADGHWSIWMTVFAELVAVRLELIVAIPGTAACFDEYGNPIPRPGGQL